MRAGIDPDDGERTDATAAYTAFGVLDIDGSGRISLRELQRYLAGDAEYFYNCVFTQADIGIEFECNRPGEVHVKKIESLSPAEYNPECAEVRMPESLVMELVEDSNKRSNECCFIYRHFTAELLGRHLASLAFAGSRLASLAFAARHLAPRQ